ncbi:MAG: hypothetical protein WD557_00460 [Dehalococcoidia bacterium]
MTTTINRLWLAFILPAFLIAAIGATVALAQGDDAPSTDANDVTTLLQEEPTPTPDPESTPPSDDGSDDDGARPDKDCPRDGGGESEDGSGSTTGISFRRR